MVNYEYHVASYSITGIISVHNALFLKGMTRTGATDSKGQSCMGKAEIFKILTGDQL